MSRSFASTIARDVKVIDDVETVTYTPGPRSPTVAAFSARWTLTRQLSADEVIASEGLWSHGDRSFTLAAAELPAGFEPAAADRIERPDGSAWVTKGKATGDDFGGTWTVVANRARA